MGAEWRNPKQNLLLLGVDDTCTSSVSKKNILAIDKEKWGKEKDDSRPQNLENSMIMVVVWWWWCWGWWCGDDAGGDLAVVVVACLCSGAHTNQENQKHLWS